MVSITNWFKRQIRKTQPVIVNNGVRKVLLNQTTEGYGPHVTTDITIDPGTFRAKDHKLKIDVSELHKKDKLIVHGSRDGERWNIVGDLIVRPGKYTFDNTYLTHLRIFKGGSNGPARVTFYTDPLNG